MTAPDVTALILAGGRSRRFGSDKARHEVEGRSMIARVYEAAAPLSRRVLVGVGGAAPRYDVPGPVQYVTDRHAEAGPLAGLQAGLLAAETPWLLALACDLPFLTTAALRTLLAARSPDADAVVAETPDGRRHPLCACYRRRILPAVEAQLAAGAFALHALLEKAAVLYVPLPEQPLRNVNARADLAATDQPSAQRRAGT